MSPCLQEQLRQYATATLGFDDCRFTDLPAPAAFDDCAAWLEAGRHGEMTYLERHLPLKRHPEKLLPGVRAAVVLTKSYRNTRDRELPQRYKVARYAVGRDYHQVMGERLQQLEAFIKERDATSECYSGVDSRPLAERELAVRAGVGFRGKNTLVIKPGQGSYFFIAVVLTTYPFAPDKPLAGDCGSCVRCRQACPTGALLAPGGLDARRCISYRTIEQKTPVTEAQIAKLNGWVFGCDICQEVCPHNRGPAALTDWPEFLPEAGVGFGAFEASAGREPRIPRSSPLCRSRQRVLDTWARLRRIAGENGIAAAGGESS